MTIPTNGKPMESAPRDGTIILVVSREWNNPSAAFQVQAAQWLCDNRGKDWRWRKPGSMGTTVHADTWFTISEFQEAQKTFSPSTPNFCPNPAVEEEDEFAEFYAQQKTVEYDL